MIILIFGQPSSGKTTLAQLLKTHLYERYCFDDIHNVDGDVVRTMFNNMDFSREGRLKNLKTISDISLYINRAKYDYTIISAIYPYLESRIYLKQNCEKWKIPFLSIYLTYDKPRERENYHVKDFEVPSKSEEIIHLNTDLLSDWECVDIIANSIHHKRITWLKSIEKDT
jgi:GTPase SAR1 family protein